jgi:aspartyl/asparaginyl beta-hydroxylase (cupin superfamily)
MGKMLVFDASLAYAVWNDRHTPRVILIVDIFHPT